MIISLIGYRGSGKSRLGEHLAAQLGWPFVDADVYLEQQAGRAIRAIFESEGEPGFRRRERDTLVELLDRPQLVLAAGGGAILNAETRRDLSAAGPVIWLQAPAEVLYNRMTADPTTGERRPNLLGGGLEEVEALLARREPLYRETASLAIDTAGRTVEELVHEILSRLNLAPPA